MYTHKLHPTVSSVRLSTQGNQLALVNGRLTVYSKYIVSRYLSTTGPRWRTYFLLSGADKATKLVFHPATQDTKSNMHSLPTSRSSSAIVPLLYSGTRLPGELTCYDKCQDRQRSATGPPLLSGITDHLYKCSESATFTSMAEKRGTQTCYNSRKKSSWYRRKSNLRTPGKIRTFCRGCQSTLRDTLELHQILTHYSITLAHL